MNQPILTEEQKQQLRVLNLTLVWPLELVSVAWPDGEIVYAWHNWLADPAFKAAVQAWLAGRPLENRFPTSGVPSGQWYHAINRTAQLGDDQVQMQFSDLDGDITRRLRLHGTGIPVRFYFFYPQNGAVVCRFEGRLGAPEIGLQVPGHALGLDKVALKAVGGLQSWQQPLPGRGFSTDCAAIHGGELDDPADVRANVECDWDLHVGGSKGLPVYHPDGTLRRFCNKDIADCPLGRCDPHPGRRQSGG
jgi:hypothetical protein